MTWMMDIPFSYQLFWEQRPVLLQVLQEMRSRIASYEADISTQQRDATWLRSTHVG